MQSLKSDGADWNEKYGETMTDDRRFQAFLRKMNLPT